MRLPLNSPLSLQSSIRVAWTLALTALVSLAYAADNLRYDPDAERRTDTFNQLVLQTRGCMREAATAMLMQGARDSRLLVTFARNTCGSPLFQYMTGPQGRSNEEASAFLNATAQDVLGRIPGLEQNAAPSDIDRPQTNSNQLGRKPNSPEDRIFSACLTKNASKLTYTSFDGGKSARALLEKDCPDEYLAWVDSCIKTGDRRNSCVLKAAILAQGALKLRNR